MSGIIGKKVGMTQIYSEEGFAIPVTLIEAGPCKIIQKKTVEREGYNSIQLGFLEKKRANKPMEGHFKKVNITPKIRLKEFKVDDILKYEIGQEVKADIFLPGEKVKVTGISKGKGFQGVVRRWGFTGGKETHGCKSKRVPGSIGSSSDPSRVWKGKKLPGRMGNQKVTFKSLKIVKVDAIKNLLYIKGALPGAKNAIVYIYKRN